MSENVSVTIPTNVVAAITGLVEKVVEPVEKVAAYFAVGGVGVADYPHLPTAVRAVMAAVGALHITATKVLSTKSPTA